MIPAKKIKKRKPNKCLVKNRSWDLPWLPLDLLLIQGVGARDARDAAAFFSKFFRQFWAKFWTIWANLGKIWVNWKKFGLNLFRFGQKSKSCISQAFVLLQLCTDQRIKHITAKIYFSLSSKAALFDITENTKNSDF